jgi:PAS domain S-box-containing protein
MDKEQLVTELTRLRQRIAALEQLEREHQQVREALQERVKELNCLYGIPKLVEKHEHALTGILQGTVDLMPPAWQYPEITCARIAFDNDEFKTENFRDTPWKLARDITIHGASVGIVEVYYTEERPESDDGPFLKEERELINAIAERLEKIIERTQMEEELRGSKEAYRSIFETTGTATAIIEEDTTLSLVNAEFERLSGYSREEIEGKKSWTEFVVGDDLERMKEYQRLRRTDPGLAPTRYEFRFIDKQGTIKDILLTVNMISGTKMSVASLLDITDRKRVEEERERILKDLDAKNREMERFTYTVSHDLRSPLVTIQGFANMLQKDLEQNEGEQAKNDLHYIASAATKMDRLLRDTLQLSRIGRIANPTEDVPFGTIVHDALEQTAGELKAHTIEVSVADDFPTVHVDQMRIVEVLVNLIANSIKYRGDEPHPKIEIGHRSEDGETVFFVHDSGIGIDKSEHGNVFDLFYQVDASVKGTGAGLAIVKRIIKVHGGRIWIESEKYKGTTVCFTLPVV